MVGFLPNQRSPVTAGASAAAEGAATAAAAAASATARPSTFSRVCEYGPARGGITCDAKTSYETSSNDSARTMKNECQ